MYDNDALLRDFGDKTIKITHHEDMSFYDIKHAVPVGKRNVRLINIRQTFNRYDAYSKLNAIETANENYKTLLNKTKDYNK